MTAGTDCRPVPARNGAESDACAADGSRRVGNQQELPCGQEVPWVGKDQAGRREGCPAWLDPGQGVIG